METKLRLAERLSSIKKCEEVIIGSIVINSASWENISTMVDERDFLFEQHRLMFRTLRLMMQEGIPVTVKSLRDQMSGHLSVESEYWRTSYYERVVKLVTPAAYVQTCINVIKSRDDRYDEFANQVGGGILKSDSGFMSETGYLPEVILDIETASCRPAISQIDEILSLVETNNLTVLTGSNEQLDLAFANALVHHCVFDTGSACGIFCRDPKELTATLLAVESRISINKLRVADLNDQDWSKISNANSKLREVPLYFSKLSSGLESLFHSLRNFASRCEKECVGGKTGLIFIFDFRTTLKASKDDISLEKSIARLRECARETGFPIVVVYPTDNSDEIALMKQSADMLFVIEDVDGNQAMINISAKGGGFLHKLKLLFDRKMMTIKIVENES